MSQEDANKAGQTLRSVQRYLRSIEMEIRGIEKLLGDEVVKTATVQGEAEIVLLDLPEDTRELEDGLEKYEAVSDKYKDLANQVRAAQLVRIARMLPDFPENTPHLEKTFYFCGYKRDPLTAERNLIFDVFTFTWPTDDPANFEIVQEKHFFVDEPLPKDVTEVAADEEYMVSLPRFSPTSHRTIWFQSQRLFATNEARIWSFTLPDTIPESEAPNWNPDPISATKNVEVIPLTPEPPIYDVGELDPTSLSYREEQSGNTILEYQKSVSGEEYRDFDGSGNITFEVIGNIAFGLIDVSTVGTTIQFPSVQYLYTDVGGTIKYDGVYQSNWSGPTIYFNIDFDFDFPMIPFESHLEVTGGPDASFMYHFFDDDGNDYLYTNGETTKSGPGSASWTDYGGRWNRSAGAFMGLPGSFTLQGPSIGGTGPTGNLLHDGLLELYQRQVPLGVGTCQAGKPSVLGFSPFTNYGTFTPTPTYPPLFTDPVSHGLNTTHFPLGTNGSCVDGFGTVTKTGAGPSDPPDPPTVKVIQTALPLNMYSIFDSGLAQSNLTVGIDGPPILQGASGGPYTMTSDAGDLWMLVTDPSDSDRIKAFHNANGIVSIANVTNQDGDPIYKFWDFDGRPGQLGWVLLNDGAGHLVYNGLTEFIGPLPVGVLPGVLGLTKASIEGSTIIIDIRKDNFIPLPYTIGSSVVFGHKTTDFVDY